MMMMGKRACLVNAVWAGEQWRQPVTLACSSEGGRLSLGGLASRRSARALASDGGPRGGQLGRRVNVRFGGCEAQGCVRKGREARGAGARGAYVCCGFCKTRRETTVEY